MGVYTKHDGIWKKIESMEKTGLGSVEGPLYAWGYNNYGNLGQNDTNNRSTPVQVGSETDWEMVACGGNHTLVIKGV